MKVLEYSDLIGKTIKAIDLTYGFEEMGYIITEDNEIYAFDIDKEDECFYSRDKEQILNSARRNYSVRKDLFENGILTEEEYKAHEKAHQERIQEQKRLSEKREYKYYLKLKEKFENK